MTNKVVLGQMATGVPGLDTLLGGGLSEFSFNVIAGAPGSCKTTLAHQIMFALANTERKALYFTVIGEPPLKMLRYQQQYSFFDISKVGTSIRYINLADDLHNGGFEGVLARIFKEVEEFQPGLVFVDSFKSVAQTAKSGNEGIADLQQFVQKLGIEMASWQATTFLIGEYAHADTESSPIFTVADGLISLSQKLHDNYVVRKIRIVKMRGQAHLAGLHTFRVGGDGLRVYPRVISEEKDDKQYRLFDRVHGTRISLGVSQLDEMLGGGLPVGYSLLVVGPSGSGKTILAATFLAEGARRGEKGIIASFERRLSRSLSEPLAAFINSGHVTVVENRSLGLSIEEVLDNLLTEISRNQITRVAIDSLAALEVALAPEFKNNFHESLYRMVAGLNAKGVSVLITMGIDHRLSDLSFSPPGNAFLADAVVALRYFENEGQLKKLISVIKVRGSTHSKELRQYEITQDGIQIGQVLSQYRDLFSGHPIELKRS